MVSAWMYVRVRAKRSCQSVRADELSRGRFDSTGRYKGLEWNLNYLKPPVLLMVNDPPPHLVPRPGRIEVRIPSVPQRLGVIIEALLENPGCMFQAGSHIRLVYDTPGVGATIDVLPDLALVLAEVAATDHIITDAKCVEHFVAFEPVWKAGRAIDFHVTPVTVGVPLS